MVIFLIFNNGFKNIGLQFYPVSVSQNAGQTMTFFRDANNVILIKKKICNIYAKTVVKAVDCSKCSLFYHQVESRRLKLLILICREN